MNIANRVFNSLRAGPCCSTSACGIVVCVKLSSEATRRESEPALISANFFISASSEQSKIPLVEKWERQGNCQAIMFDDERLNPRRVSNLPHNKRTSHPHLESEEELSALIIDVLTKFQSISG